MMTEKELKDLVKEEVLRFLPAKTLTRLKAVSREWNRQIQKPLLQFHQSYHFNKLSGFFLQNMYDLSFISLDHSSYGVPDPNLAFLTQSVSILSSSNGFLLCRDRVYGSLYVCNPVTQKFNILPESEIQPCFLADESVFVLGFEPSGLNMECHYHVVTAIKSANMSYVIFETYASKRGTWEQEESLILDEDETTSILTGNTFYYKGVAYWETTTKKVVAFDVKNVGGEVISLPEEISENGAFGEIKGEICYLCILSSVLKIYNLAQREWHREIVLGIDQSLGWILPGFDGKTVMIHSGRSIYSCCLDDDEEEEDEFRSLVDVPFELDFEDKRSYFGYVNTFALIK